MKINGSSGGFGRLHSRVSIPLHYVPLHTDPSITTSKVEGCETDFFVLGS